MQDHILFINPLFWVSFNDLLWSDIKIQSCLNSLVWFSSSTHLKAATCMLLTSSGAMLFIYSLQRCWTRGQPLCSRRAVVCVLAASVWRSRILSAYLQRAQPYVNYKAEHHTRRCYTKASLISKHGTWITSIFLSNLFTTQRTRLRSVG